jgi:hemerythrin-like domain-containing protein
MSKVEGWPEQPFQLISSTSCHILAPALPKTHHAVRVAQLMALTHNTIFRAFNAIYHQARAIDPSNNRDVTDFVTFATFAVAFLDNHHQCEELIFFPMLEAQSKSPGLMATNVGQHRAFDASLRALRQCLEDVRTATAPFNASELRARIDELAMPLERHLRDEIPSLLEVGQRVGEQTMRVCYKALHDEAEGTTDPFKFVALPSYQHPSK